ncbi:hypothetical protein HG421_11880 [Xanthomonas campestris pv. badrii]|uniref:Uncharacterized protein n=1 Tax=Xanthomonas campestris pv. badrii TaxID=149696 RepID=A0A7Z2VAZ6_XANCA|nr:hypothetical protein [Xanthomonas campestris]MCC4605113.1 hypothetical protein [Xanthomonas campestris pv. parthenii]QJD68331.1 hypothetical protein HG421_11880 [Xanthomonas campestris pv. badrii]
MSIKDSISRKIENAISTSLENVIDSRGDHYSNHPDKRPTQDNVSSLISSSANTNAVITGGSSLIPGPWGMAAVLPELTVVIHNQIKLIYDIGVAHGKEKIITKELVLGIFISALGTSAGSVLTIQGGRVLVKRASLRAIQKMIAMLGGRITQQAIKSAVSKWLPLVGAAAMATWTRYTTKKIGERAQQIFRLDIQDDPSTGDIELASHQQNT